MSEATDDQAKRAHQSLLAQLGRSSLLALAVRSLGMLATYLVQLLLARRLELRAYGTIAFAQTLVLLLGLAGAFGTPTAGVRFLSEYIARNADALARGFIRRSSQIALAGGMTVAAIGVVGVLLAQPEEYDQQVLIIGLIATPFVALTNTQEALIRAFGSVGRALAGLNLYQPSLLAVLVIALAIKGDDADQAMAAIAASFVLTALIQEITRRRCARDLRKSSSVSFQTLQWIGVSGRLLLGGAMLLVLNYADVMMVGLLRGPTEVGIYAVTARTAVLVALGLTALNTVVPQMISKLHARGASGAVTDVIRWSRAVALGFGAAVLITFAFAGEGILRFFGDEFATGHAALLILGTGQLVNAGFGPVGTALNMTGHERLVLAAGSLAAVTNLALNTVLIPRLGIEGAALSTAISLTLWNVMLARAWRTQQRPVRASSRREVSP